MRTKRTPDEHKHQAILRAAIQLFLKNGYSKTSMDAVALAAKVTKQTVYAHYHSKDMLFTDMVTELCRKHAPSKGALADKGQSIEGMLYTLGLSFLNMVSSKEGLAATRLVVAEAHHHPKLAQRYYESGSRQMLMIVADFLESQNKAGKLCIPNPMSAASYFFSMLKGNYYLRILLNIKPLPSPGEKEKHVRETVSIFMRIYGGDSPLHTRNVL
jgi:TetR/AcrR family transcriptional regulator, mexJK operon transcriptional repressor